MMRQFFRSYLLFIVLLVEKTLCEKEDFLLVISLDGFRHDYLDNYSTKNGFLHKVATSGARACWSDSVFPSIFFLFIKSLIY